MEFNHDIEGLTLEDVRLVALREEFAAAAAVDAAKTALRTAEARYAAARGLVDAVKAAKAVLSPPAPAVAE